MKRSILAEAVIMILGCLVLSGCKKNKPTGTPTVPQVENATPTDGQKSTPEDTPTVTEAPTDTPTPTPSPTPTISPLERIE